MGCFGCKGRLTNEGGSTSQHEFASFGFQRKQCSLHTPHIWKIKLTAPNFEEETSKSIVKKQSIFEDPPPPTPKCGSGMKPHPPSLGGVAFQVFFQESCIPGHWGAEDFTQIKLKSAMQLKIVCPYKVGAPLALLKRRIPSRLGSDLEAVDLRSCLSDSCKLSQLVLQCAT